MVGNDQYVAGTYGEYGEVKGLTVGENSLVVGHIVQNGATGGIVGMTNAAAVRDCTNRALVVGTGSLSSYRSVNSGSVAVVYGLVGVIFGTVERCANYGTVVSRESAGGIVGNVMGNSSAVRGAVRLSVNYGKAYAETTEGEGATGGIAVNAGGYGFQNLGAKAIEGCVNFGEVEGSFAGGILQRGGGDVKIRYSANRRRVSATCGAAGSSNRSHEARSNCGAVTMRESSRCCLPKPRGKRRNFRGRHTRSSAGSISFPPTNNRPVTP